MNGPADRGDGARAARPRGTWFYDYDEGGACPFRLLFSPEMHLWLMWLWCVLA